MEKSPLALAVSCLLTYFSFSQLWFPTVHEVLHADWQDVWHSPQPPFFMDSLRSLVVKVLICLFPFILFSFHESITFESNCLPNLISHKNVSFLNVAHLQVLAISIQEILIIITYISYTFNFFA